MASTGLSADRDEYRTRLADTTDEQIDTWASELLRDVVKRRGIVRVIQSIQHAAHIDDRGFQQAFAYGGGAPATVGRDGEGHIVVPTITLYHLVPGIRATTDDGRQRLIDYLVENFDELVYV